MVTTNNLLTYEASGCGRTALNEVILPPSETLPLAGTAEERLIYFLDGRGIASIYEAAPGGDVYEVRQDLSVYLTPGIQIEIINDFVVGAKARNIEVLVRGLDAQGKGSPSAGADITVANPAAPNPQDQQ